MKLIVNELRQANVKAAAIIFDVDRRITQRKRLVLLYGRDAKLEQVKAIHKKVDELLPPVIFHQLGQKQSTVTDQALAQRINKARAVAPNAPIHWVFAVRRNLARALSEMSPSRYGGPESRSITNFEFAVVTVDPEQSQGLLQFQINFKNEAAAAAMGRKIGELVKQIESEEDADGIPPVFGKILNATRITYHSKMIRMEWLKKRGSPDQVMGKLILGAISAEQQARDTKNIRNVALAIHTHHDANRGFPPFAKLDSNNKPLLSWRVMILPFLPERGAAKLYEKFKLDEPWNSEHNKKLIPLIPKSFQNFFPSVKLGETTILAPRHKNIKTAFGPKPVNLRDLANADGTSHTIMLVNAAPKSATIWTKPDDFVFDSSNPTAGLIEKHSLGFLVASADATVHFLPAGIEANKLVALLGREDGVQNKFPHSVPGLVSPRPKFWFFEFFEN